jgi:hypothetical protein
MALDGMKPLARHHAFGSAVAPAAAELGVLRTFSTLRERRMSEGLGQLRVDTAEHPRLFCWYGPIDPRRLSMWAEGLHLRLPADLRALWLQFGGGEIFETEEVLVPFDGPSYAAGFEARNTQHREAGLPLSLRLFHAGYVLSAFRNAEPRYVTVDPSTYAVRGEFDSLDEWYRRALRAEYAARYGLGPEQGGLGRRTTSWS